MDFEVLENRFRVFFRCYGLNQFSAYTKMSLTWKKRFCNIIPGVGFLFAITVMYYMTLGFLAINFRQAGQSVVSYIHVTIELFLQFSVLVPELILYENMKKLWKSYAFIEKYMKIRMRFRVDFSRFQMRIYHLVVLVLTPYVFSIIARKSVVSIDPLTNKPFTDRRFINNLLTFYCFTGLAQIHVIIHLELLKYFFLLISECLRSRSLDFSAASQYRQKNMSKMQQLNGYVEIVHLKLIHYKLWEISRNVNRIFGWGLGVIFVRNFTEIAYAVYYIYFFSSTGGYLSLLRE